MQHFLNTRLVVLYIRLRADIRDIRARSPDKSMSLTAACINSPVNMSFVCSMRATDINMPHSGQQHAQLTDKNHTEKRKSG